MSNANCNCDLIYPQLKKMDKNMINLPTCNICGIPFTTKSSLRRHLLDTHLEQPQSLHRCPWFGCDYESPRRSMARQHAKRHLANNAKSKLAGKYPTVDQKALASLGLNAVPIPIAAVPVA